MISKLGKLSKLALASSVTFSLLSAGCSEGKNEARSENPVSGFDIVINNGRVMDPETEFDGIRNVGIKVSRIVTITGVIRHIRYMPFQLIRGHNVS